MADLSPFPPVALCVSVQGHPLCPPTASLLATDQMGSPGCLGIPWHPEGSVCSLGSWLSVGAPAPATRRLALLCSLSYTFFSAFSYFRTHLFLARIPPDSQVTALYDFLLISLNSAASIPKSTYFCYIGGFISQPCLTWCHLGGLTSLHTPKLPYNYVVCVGNPTPKTKIPNANHCTSALIPLPVSNQAVS